MPSWREVICLEITREEVGKYLCDVKTSVKADRYEIAPRPRNQSIYIDYVFSERLTKEILLDLEVDDFSDAVQNDHPQHPEEILFIFGKEVELLPKEGGEAEKVALYIKFNKLENLFLIVISFHKQEYPLKYKFK